MRRRLQRYVWVGVLPVFGGMFAVLNGKLGAAGTARPLSIAPAQGEWLNVSRQTVVRTAPRERKAKESEERGKLPGALAECRNLGRKRERLQAAHRRAALGVNCTG